MEIVLDMELLIWKQFFSYVQNVTMVGRAGGMMVLPSGLILRPAKDYQVKLE